MSSTDEIVPGDIVAVNHGMYGRKEGLVIGSSVDYAGRQVVEVQFEPGEVYKTWYPNREDVYSDQVSATPEREQAGARGSSAAISSPASFRKPQPANARATPLASAGALSSRLYMLSPPHPLLEFIQSSYAAQQLAPFVVLLGLPAFALLARAHWHALSALVHMVLESFGVSFLWNWGAGSAETAAAAVERRRAKKKGVVRTRKDQVEMNGLATYSDSTDRDDDDDDLCYPGLVNVSGTYCFLNSVLQAMASLSYLQPHIEAIHARAVELDVPTPVIDTLQETLRTLNTPRSSSSSFRPVPMINALSQPVPGKRSKLFASREHQDAQELFQLISECVKAESAALARESLRDRGLGAFASANVPEGAEVGPGVFDGLTANRRSCVECGYTEAVMHFAFDNWTLSLPRNGGACALQDCLADYIRLELLTDCICRKCSMLATHERLRQEADSLKESVAKDAGASQSKKKRAREARKLEAKVRAAIEEGRIEEDIKGVKMEKVFSKASTKQAMVARPPKVLVLHLNRSIHHGGSAGRNPCRVFFPEVLDLTPYTTSGQLSTLPSVPISTPPPAIPRSTTPTQSIYATPRVFYRLSAVVCHYGMHSFGHYVCFRRKPRAARGSDTAGPSAPTTPRMACPHGCECAECAAYGPVRDGPRPPAPGRGWLRTSDSTVEECGLERVLGEGGGAFLLFYERVAQVRPPVYAAHSPRSSEETVRPASAELGLNGNGSGSVDSLSDDVSTGVGASLSASGIAASLVEGDAGRALLMRPRVVRRTAAGGRSRSASAAPAERTAGALTPLPLPEVPLSSSMPQLGRPLLNGHALIPPGAPEHLEDVDVVKVELPESVSAPARISASSASTSTSASASTSSSGERTPVNSLFSPPLAEPQRSTPASTATAPAAPDTPAPVRPTPAPKAAQARIQVQAPQPVLAAAHTPLNIV
ncbi:hypothetical protein M0805_009361, partial [Coniferiporia weirii]